MRRGCYQQPFSEILPACTRLIAHPNIRIRICCIVQIGFEIPVRVYHEDTDGGGIVYYANYLKYMERARTEFLRSLGFEQDELKQQHSCIFVVTHVDIDYRHPAKFNDSLSVSCELLEMRRASFRVRQNVYKLHRAETGISSVSNEAGYNNSDNSANIHAPGALLTASSVSLACLHSETLAPHRIPGTLSEVLANAT